MTFQIPMPSALHRTSLYPLLHFAVVFNWKYFDPKGRFAMSGSHFWLSALEGEGLLY